mmetsp:Transcript_35307/g.88994  ORF Transcript_35307/g.88994 Transcript_35307/m.88994 type:complete len:229 (-) Transcript_35307:36-722(-)
MVAPPHLRHAARRSHPSLGELLLHPPDRPHAGEHLGARALRDGVHRVRAHRQPGLLRAVRQPLRRRLGRHLRPRRRAGGLLLPPQGAAGAALGLRAAAAGHHAGDEPHVWPHDAQHRQLGSHRRAAGRRGVGVPAGAAPGGGAAGGHAAQAHRGPPAAAALRPAVEEGRRGGRPACRRAALGGVLLLLGRIMPPPTNAGGSAGGVATRVLRCRYVLRRTMRTDPPWDM